MAEKSIRWAQLQKIFPNETARYKQQFLGLFKQLGKDELTVEDIDRVLSQDIFNLESVRESSISLSDLTEKTASYLRYFYDNIGTILGKIEVDDDGNSFVYDRVGTFLGSCREGQTFDAQGNLIAQSDITSALLVKEERA